jgi:hypothetical protein
MRHLAIALLATFFLVGCGASPTYKASVKKYATGVAERHAVCYDRVQTEPLRRELVINDASLACAVDRQAGDSTNDQPTPACRCADASSTTWVDRCAAFLGGDQ